MVKNRACQRKYLQRILKLHPNTLRYEVAAEALCYSDIKTFFYDLLTNGCQSGIIGTLIYYSDSRAFYDKYYSEIESLREELEDALGIPLQPKGDLKNWFAWMAFEETARVIAEELGLDI